MDFAIFEDTLNSQLETSYFFSEPVQEVIIYPGDDLESAFTELTRLQKNGYFLAGYIAYDYIFYANLKLANLSLDEPTCNPLIHFTAFRKMVQFPSSDLEHIINKYDPVILKCLDYRQQLFKLFELEDDYLEYCKKFAQVQEELKKGNSYQVNLTLNAQLEKTVNGNYLQLYYNLTRSQKVAYAAYLPCTTQTVISVSPELFFKKMGDKLIVRPMKGTSPRGNDAYQDKVNSEWLANDSKNLAENLIIVDLMRNDLAKLAMPGSVIANKLFTVEKYASLFQMTSELCARVNPEINFTQILNSLFPCGSITGAPKLKTMEIIDQIETSKRGIYTGAIGFILPNNDMAFNVAIRTLVTTKKSNHLRIGVGGGITINSSPMEEWAEIKTKLKFVTQYYKPDFNLVDSMLIKEGKIQNLAMHLNRLTSSSERLGFDFSSSYAKSQLLQYIDINKLGNETSKSFKLRIELAYTGEILIEHTELPASNAILNIAVLAENINTSSPLFRHKTTSKLTRGLYDELYRHYKPQHIDELIFINQHKVITESRYFNFIIRLNDQLHTSPATSGLLPGVYRHNLLSKGIVSEKELTLDMLKAANEFYLCNDVRGLIKCNYLGIVG